MLAILLAEIAGLGRRRGGLDMKKFFAAIVAVVVLTVSFATVLASSYVGNSNSGKFHYADCPTVAKMNPNNKVFINTREEAIAAGYIPCKRCKP